MQKLFDSYLEHLAQHPDEVHAIILWTITCLILTIIMVKSRKESVQGSKGPNGLWESPEYITHIVTWIVPYVCCFVIYFQITSMIFYAWGVLGGTIAYAIGGRWVFEWALAFRSGAKKVEEVREVSNTGATKEVVKTETAEPTKPQLP